jgi:RNA polymerase primary sigma factor
MKQKLAISSNKDSTSATIIETILAELANSHKKKIKSSTIINTFEKYSLNDDAPEKILNFFQKKNIEIIYDIDDLHNKNELKEFLSVNISQHQMNNTKKNSGSDIFQNSKLISAAEEVKLIQLINSKNKQNVAYARNKLIEGNLKLVYSIARKHLHRGMSIDDLIQEGIIGLQDATKTYDVKNASHARFSTHATFAVIKRINEYVINHKALIRTPVSLNQVANIIMKKENELIERNGVAPTIEQLAKALSKEKITVEKILQVKNITKPVVSIDKKTSGDENNNNLSDYIVAEGNQEQEMEREYKHLELYKTMHLVLNAEEEKLIAMNHGMSPYTEPMTLNEIAKKMGYTINKIRQIKERAEQKLANSLKNKFRIFFHNEFSN